MRIGRSGCLVIAALVLGFLIAAAIVPYVHPLRFHGDDILSRVVMAAK